MQVERLVLGGGTAGATGGDRKRLIDLGRNLWHYLTDRLDARTATTSPGPSQLSPGASSNSGLIR
jgi:hypothetical protein